MDSSSELAEELATLQADASRYRTRLMVGHLSLWSGIAWTYGQVAYIDMQRSISWWPAPLIIAGIGLLWWAQRSDES